MSDPTDPTPTPGEHPFRGADFPYRAAAQPDLSAYEADGLLVPDEVIPALKAKAAAANGGVSSDLCIVTVDMEPPRQVAMRMPTDSEFIGYFDAAADSANGGDPSMQYASLWCMYPSRAALATYRKAMYLLPNKLCDAVERAVGADKPQVYTLNTNTSPEELAEHNIPGDIARSLLSAYPAKGAIKIARITVSPEGAEEPESFSIVLKPLGNATAALQKGFQGKAKYSAIRSALGAAIVHPIGATKEDLFRRYVGLPSIHLLAVMLEMGGSSTRTVAKKV